MESKYTAAREVVIVQRRLANYRLPLFELMREKLEQRGIRLRVLYGPDSASDAIKKDAGVLPWGELVPTRYFLNDRLCWQQPFVDCVRNADLLIVTQENKILYNYWLLLRKRRPRIAFWGHGRNMQSDNPDGLRERIKRWSTSRADWWFAYTEISVGFVVSDGFPRERVTLLNNAADTRQMAEWKRSIDGSDVAALRASLALGSGPVAISIGSMYKEKRLAFLIEAARRIRAYLPTFELLMVGTGPDERVMREATRNEPWVHWLGPRRGKEKVLLMSIAQVMLNPGLVGLGILDSFVCGVPMFTTDCGLHSPEIAYLKQGENGVMARNDLDAYVGELVSALSNPLLLERLRNGCIRSGRLYTIENMADAFVGGIEACLEEQCHVA